jgi:O-antigen/teichoic acid export membrane protein
VRLLKNSIIYSGLGILEKGIGILLLPIYTRFLSPAEYGTVSVVDSLTAFLVLIYPIGADATLVRTQFTENNPTKLAKLRGTLFTFLLTVGLLGTAVLSIGREWLIKPLAGDIPFWPFLALGLLSAWFQPVQRAYLSILQARQDAWGFLFQAGGSSILRIALVFLFVVGFRWGAFGLLFAIVLPYIVFSIIALWYLRKEVLWGIDWPALRNSLAYSLPVVPHLLAGWTTAFLGTIVLNHYEGTSDVGIFGLATRFALIVGFVVNGVAQALQPQMYGFLSSPTMAAVSMAQRKVLVSLSLFGIIAVSVSFLSVDLIRMMATPAFYGAAALVPILALAAFIQGAYTFYANALYFEERGPRFLPIASISGAVISLAMMFWLIPKYAAYGTAVATLAGVATRMLIASLIGSRKAAIYWSQVRFFLIITIVTALCYMGWIGVASEWPLSIRALIAISSSLLILLVIPLSIFTSVFSEMFRKVLKRVSAVG